ncbi:MAG: c-type cytochrome [Candidatus Binatia bacterium]
MIVAKTSTDNQEEHRMKRRFMITAFAMVVGWGAMSSTLSAAESDQGRAYFVRYCASCHGVEGKGDGTVSRSLKIKPADLTQLQKRNKGQFPLEKIMATIDGRTRVEAHGESKMPVWGELFEKEATPQKDPTATATAKVKVIADYVSTLQR